MPARPCALPVVGKQSGPPTPRPEFLSLYHATLAPLRRYLAGLLNSREDAQDVAQDAYVRVHAAWAGEEIRSPRTFLFTVARRLAINRIRSRRRDRIRCVDSGELGEVPSDVPSVERIVEARFELARLHAIIDQLPPACRRVFLLRRLHDLTHDEIARKLGISPKTVENQMTIACRQIRRAYDAAERSERLHHELR